MGTQRHPSAQWTNEKHMHFLSSIEASFVRAMFENNINNDVTESSNGAQNSRRPLRLDRYIPDSHDSTLDSISQRRKMLHPSSSSDRIVVPPTTRRRPSQISNSSHRDQVVPEFTAGCKAAK